MINSFEEYKSLLTKSFKKIPSEKLIIFSMRVSQRVDDKYHQELSLRGFQKEADLATETLNLLSEINDHPEKYPTAVLEEYLIRLYKASHVITANLDLSEVYQLGRYKLINALEYCIVYVMEKKLKHLAGCAFCPFDIISLILVKEGLDMTDRDKHIDHPLFQEEISFQLSLLRDAGIKFKEQPT